MAALLVVILGALVPATATGAPQRPSERERQQRIEEFRAKVADAKEKLDALNEREGIADEEYLQARAALDQTNKRLAAARDSAGKAKLAARRASDDLSERAKAAYEGTGSVLELILGATSYAEFSDRLEFMGQIAADDSEAVNRATVAGQRATWASEELASALADNKDAVADSEAKKAALNDAVAAQQDLLGGLEEKLRIALIPPPPPEPPPPPVIQTPDPIPSPDPSPTGDTGGTDPTTDPDPNPDPTTPPPPPPPPPPAPAPGAQAALAAAYSVIGVPYVYAGASPETGFDCSGLTMWSWAHAGVSLPHSSAMQYAVLPHVDQSQLQPGDLLFFYSPIHHVAMYVGGGNMIHAPHTGGHVEVIPVYWEWYVGAARPG